MPLDKVNTHQRSLSAQQAVFTRPHSDRENVIHASFVVSELIAKKLRPHSEGQFVKECLFAAVELLASDKVKLFQSSSLSRRTVAEQITDMAQDIETTLNDTEKKNPVFLSGLRWNNGHNKYRPTSHLCAWNFFWVWNDRGIAVYASHAWHHQRWGFVWASCFGNEQIWITIWKVKWPCHRWSASHAWLAKRD